MTNLVFTSGPVPKSMREQRVDAQRTSRLSASRHGEPWTKADYDVIESDVTHEQAAQLLGRTVHAVRNKRGQNC